MENIDLTEMSTDSLFEQGYAMVAVGGFRLCNQHRHQEAYDQLGQVVDLLMQERQALRKSGKVKRF